MKYKFNSINKLALFNSLNQWDNKKQRMMCSFFAPAINLKYNCWIELTEDDLMIIAEKQSKIKSKREWQEFLFDYKKWWYWEDWVNAILDYVIENSEARNWEIPNLAEFKREDKNELFKWHERGYMAIIGIKVNDEYYEDAKDWLIEEYEDYISYKWDIWHFTNTMIWKCWFSWDCQDYDKEYIVDSYAFNKRDNKWMYECNLKELIEDISMTTKYIFY